MDVQDLLDHFRVPYVGSEHKHGRAGWVQLDCPHCGKGSNKFHLGINTATGATNCWRCGPQGMVAVIAAVAGVTTAEVSAKVTGVQFVRGVPIAARGKLVLPADRVDLLDSQPHCTYLAGRGYPPATMARLWGLQAIGRAASLAWRVFIPIHLHGEIVSWTTRAIGALVVERYRSASSEQEAMLHRSCLYGEDYCRHAVIIHEGPADVWATGPGSVATFGTAVTPAQVLRLAKYPVRVVCFDRGGLAQRQARALADMLAGYPGDTYNVQLETGDDAGDASCEELADLRHRFLN